FRSQVRVTRQDLRHQALALWGQMLNDHERHGAFFDGLRRESAMAFLLVQHLPPERESLMAEILARHTHLPVLQVTGGLTLQAGHVYVTRPGFTVTLERGVFKLGEPVEKRGHRRPVDDFFRDRKSTR